MKPGILEIDLRSRVRRIGLVIVAASAVIGGSYRVARLAWAEEQLGSYNISRVERAIHVDPQNAALHDWAGVLRLSIGQQPFSGATAHFRRATELNPLVARYWLHLGMACFIDGDIECADSAHAQAAQRARMSPEVANEVGTYYLATGDPDKALEYFGRVVALRPELAVPVFRSCLHAMDPERTWHAIVRNSENAKLKIQFVSLVKELHGAATADAYWAEVVNSKSKTIALEDAKSYLAQLETDGDLVRIARVWQDLELMRANGLPSRPQGNLVINGDFKQAPTNFGLDWHLRSEKFLESHIVNEGDRSTFQVDFTVPSNLEHEPLSEIVPVSPASRYEVRAQVRSEEITSDSGPRLRVQDPQCSECVIATAENTTGTTDWHDIRTEFLTSPNTNFIRLSIWRPRSRSFPTEIRGRYWITGIAMSPSAQ